MQRLGEREENILDFIVRDYIRSAAPVSSGRVFRGLKLDVSPATIRNIMVELDEVSLLEQPHTSAGRIPTDKAYRYFVDYLMEYEKPSGKVGDVIDELAREIHKRHEFLFERLGKVLAGQLRLFTGIAHFNDGVKADGFGLGEVLREPEFENRARAVEFARLLDDLAKLAEGYRRVCALNKAGVFIGDENPFPQARGFSAVSLKFADEDVGEWVVFSLGPKRMNYERASSLLSFAVRDIMEELRR